MNAAGHAYPGRLQRARAARDPRLPPDHGENGRPARPQRRGHQDPPLQEGPGRLRLLQPPRGAIRRDAPEGGQDLPGAVRGRAASSSPAENGSGRSSWSCRPSAPRTSGTRCGTRCRRSPTRILAWDSGSFQFLEGEERTGREHHDLPDASPSSSWRACGASQDPALFQQTHPQQDIVFERVLPAQRPTGPQGRGVREARLPPRGRDAQRPGDLRPERGGRVRDPQDALHLLHHRLPPRAAPEGPLRRGAEGDGAICGSWSRATTRCSPSSTTTSCGRWAPSRRTSSRSTWARLKIAQAEVFTRVTLRSNGALSEERLLENLKAIEREPQARRSWTPSTSTSTPPSWPSGGPSAPSTSRRSSQTLRSTRKDLFHEPA